jgi:glycosyltransferase involved in cell wall biosynthesis
VLACARAADCVIATDRALEPAVRTHLAVPSERVRVIPNALDLDAVDALAQPADGARARMEAGIATGETVLLSVGRLEENKGFQVLIAALAALERHGGAGGWRWVLVGDGPHRKRLEEAILDARLADRVVLTGRLGDRDLHAWYEAADLFVHPTLYEGSSPPRRRQPGGRTARQGRSRRQRLAGPAGRCLGSRGGDQRSAAKRRTARADGPCKPDHRRT